MNEDDAIAQHRKWLAEETARIRELSFEQKLALLKRTESEIKRSPHNIPARRDKAKGKVRLRWDHKRSVNVTQYRIDKIQTESLVEEQVEPNPAQLSRAELRFNMYLYNQTGGKFQ